MKEDILALDDRFWILVLAEIWLDNGGEQFCYNNDIFLIDIFNNRKLSEHIWTILIMIQVSCKYLLKCFLNDIPEWSGKNNYWDRRGVIRFKVKYPIDNECYSHSHY